LRVALFVLVSAVGIMGWGCSGKKSKQRDATHLHKVANNQSARLVPIASKEKKQVSTYQNLDRYYSMCGDSAIALGPIALEIARILEAKQFAYAPRDTADCSGMFHRLMLALRERCPNQQTPPLRQYRDTRDLAKWYHEHDQLILVPKDSMLAYQGLIKPGAVMFYGYGGRSYNKFKASDLFKRGTGINHVGVVVQVDYNESGEVDRYHLFHGRNPRYLAGISGFHTRIPTRATYPPLGNGPEQWVAFAPLSIDMYRLEVE